VARTETVDQDLLNSYMSQTGQPLGALSAEAPLLLVFLRHFGCTFCREAVDELSKKRAVIQAQGPRLAFVHLGTEDKAKTFFAPYGLADVPRFADPEGRLYKTFGLLRAEWRQYLNRESLFRMVMAWMSGHFVGPPAGDVQRMPGTFLVQGNQIRKAFRHKLVSDRPDYVALASFK
jgi:peroxiredoxin